ncbi:acyltransferase [Empedobacter falsenii]
MNTIWKLFYFISKFLKIAESKYYKSVIKNHPNVEIKGDFNFKFDNFFELQNNIKKLYIGKNVRWNSNNMIRIYNGAELILEDNSYFSDFVSINCLHKIVIGENSWIGEGSKLYDHNHSYVTEPEYEWKVREFDKAPIIIGKNVKIYSNVTILKGVTIGDNVIIGAGCVIHKDVPANSIIVNKQEQLVKEI